MNNGAITYVLIAALVLFAVFRRARGLFTRQKVREGPMKTRIAVFGVIGLLLLVPAVFNPVLFAGDALGLVAGGLMAYFGLRLTVFDRQADGLYYTPNRYIGLAVFVIFLARFAYRLIESASLIQSSPRPLSSGGNLNVASQLAGDPITGAAYFLLIGYYVFYYVALILRSRQPVVPGS